MYLFHVESRRETTVMNVVKLRHTTTTTLIPVYTNLQRPERQDRKTLEDGVLHRCGPADRRERNKTTFQKRHQET